MRKNKRERRLIRERILNELTPPSIPLDEETIRHLVKDHGFPEGDIRHLATQGYKYVPSRNSFISPLEWEGFKTQS